MAVEIQAVTIANLIDFYEDYHRSPRGCRPISRARAVAQARNPQSRPDDVALLVARENGTCVGYLGILPGLLRQEDRFLRVNAFSTWFVEPGVRHSGAGGLLMLKALGLGHHVLACGMGPDSIRALSPLKMIPLGPLVYSRLVLDRVMGIPLAPIRILRRAWRLASGRDRDLNPVFLAARRLLRPFKAPVLNALAQGQPLDVTWVHAAHAPLLGTDAETPAVAMHRGAEVVNWMVDMPSGAVPPGCEDDRAYHFNGNLDSIQSGVSELQSHGGGAVRGWAHWLATRAYGRTKLRLLDTAFRQPQDAAALPALLSQLGRATDADEMEFPDALSSRFLGNPLLRRNLHMETVPYLLWISRRRSNEIDPSRLSHFVPRMADGDMGFP